jgi:hypothetical protein
MHIFECSEKLYHMKHPLLLSAVLLALGLGLINGFGHGYLQLFVSILAGLALTVLMPVVYTAWWSASFHKKRNRKLQTEDISGRTC